MLNFFLATLGCPKNIVDSEMMGELLREAGHREVDDPRHADILIVNTCGFIEPARQESYEALEELAAEKRPGQSLVAAGCLAQRYGDEIHRHVPEVDAIIGTQSWPEIVDLVDRLEKGEAPRVWQGGRRNLVASVHRRPTSGATAYLKIADGCSASCAFCAIPLIKGPQRSKPEQEIFREAQELAKQGVREIILIAQNTTAYARDMGKRDALPDLLLGIADEVSELDWLRILYAYPQDVTPRLIETMAHLPQVCHYLDLPLQHGHPEVLRRMGRPQNVEGVLQLIEDLREAMPDIALRSTFIVGYPGETDEKFEALLDFMEEIAFDKVGIFSYSPEEGTAAARLPDRVDPETMAERYDRAMMVQQQISLARNIGQVGRQLPVLVDGAGDGISVGRTYRDAPEIDGLVLMPGEIEPGEFVDAEIVQAQEYDLIATPLS